jgi:hypothetical protein
LNARFSNRPVEVKRFQTVHQPVSKYKITRPARLSPPLCPRLGFGTHRLAAPRVLIIPGRDPSGSFFYFRISAAIRFISGNLCLKTDLTGLLWTKRCEVMSLETSMGHAEEEVWHEADRDAASSD